MDKESTSAILLASVKGAKWARRSITSHLFSENPWRLVPNIFTNRWCVDGRNAIPNGTIPWKDHVYVHNKYIKYFSKSSLTAKDIHLLGGFCILEIVYYGCASILERWKPVTSIGK